MVVGLGFGRAPARCAGVLIVQEMAGFPDLLPALQPGHCFGRCVVCPCRLSSVYGPSRMPVHKLSKPWIMYTNIYGVY